MIGGETSLAHQVSCGRARVPVELRTYTPLSRVPHTALLTRASSRGKNARLSEARLDAKARLAARLWPADCHEGC